MSRSVMTLAVLCLGDRHREWALAMQAEFEEALQDGKALSFAIGCLAGAWREMPTHQEGRFVLTSYALALGVIVPVAALLSLAAMLGFPYVDFGQTGMDGTLSGNSGQAFLLNDGSRAAAPSLTLLVLLVAGTHLLLAWWMLERDWERVAVMIRFGAATATTFALVNGVASLETTRMFPLIAAFLIELTAIAALARWHAQLRRSA